jgi:hypothetical protein
VPGVGPHPGNAAWGAATTSPLPAVGTEAAEADLAAEAEAAEPVSDSYATADAFGSEPMADVGRSASDFSSAPSVELGPPSVTGQPSAAGREDEVPAGDRSGFDWGRGAGQGDYDVDPLGMTASASSPSGVVVPPAEHVATENRLPIFEAVESDWFRRGRTGVAAGAVISATGSQGPGFGGGSGSDGWPSYPEANGGTEPHIAWAASAADQGWEAAAAASSPATGGTTTAGLPKRVPQANLVPGTASPEPATPAPARSAAVTRERFASFQRGVKEGRAAVANDDAHSDGDDGSR